MLKKFSWPYRVLMVLCLVGLYGFMRQPDVLLEELKSTADSGNEAQWQALTAEAKLQPYAKALMTGLLKMKYAADWDAGNRGDAMNSYYAGQEQLEGLSKQLAGGEGFRHFVCGDLMSFPSLPEWGAEGCWQLDGVVRWVSPTEVRVYFTNPVSGWQSSLLLQRDGLFSWQVAGVELPVEQILAAYDKLLKE